MKYKLPYLILLFFTVLTLFAGCTDEIIYPQDYDIPDGEGDVLCELTCTMPLSQKLGSRTPGDAIEEIGSLCVLIYNMDGKLFKKERIDLNTYKPELVNQKSPDDALDGNEQDQKQTYHIEFPIKNLPFGKYYFYAIANMGDLEEYDLENAEDLKKIKVKWNENVIKKNNQMFGYFTDMGNMKSKGFDADPITFKESGQKIHSWIKRTVSKVTIAYDGGGLNDNVFVYIHNVTLYDIPEYCYIAKDNRADEKNPLINPYKYAITASERQIPIKNSRFIYNKEGQIINLDGDSTVSDDTSGEDKDNYDDWMVLTNAYTYKDKGGLGLRGSDHSASAASLFFFENNQGDKSGMGVDYDKEQKRRGKDGVGTKVNTPTYDENGNPLNDYKDRVPYGTFIEVEGYYISINKGNSSQGPIKYRFMLGKDTHYNYDAARNYHYKLTLGFKGWANQPDWHIDYEEEDPGIEVGPVVRIPYLYNTKATLPIKLNGTCTELKLEIVENNWAPFDEATGDVPNNPVESSPSKFEFKWAKYIYDATANGMNGVNRPYLGFLALAVPGNTPEEIPANIVRDKSNKDGDEGQQVLRAYYEGNTAKQGTDKNTIPQNVRIFYENDLKVKDGEYVYAGAENNNWQVNPIIDLDGNVDTKSCMLLAPLWTRNKNMIHNANFSGNNPYQYYSRKAVIHFTGKFKIGDKEVPKEADCIVYQEPRIVNPKAVWRKADSQTPFHVNLKTTRTSNAMSDYKPLVSIGTWTAEVEDFNHNFIQLQASGTSEVKNGVVYGKAQTEIDFNIIFTGTATDEHPNYAIITVRYHAENCVHKILVCQGYELPVEMGGNKWSNFTVYSTSGNDDDDPNKPYTVTLSKNPLTLGSLFRRGRLAAGILPGNVARGEGFQAMGMPGTNQTPAEFEVTRAGKTEYLRWNYNVLNNQNGYSQGYLSYKDQANTDKVKMGNFIVDGVTYRVPDIRDFFRLTIGNEFAFGIVYGDTADDTKELFDEAAGYSDYDNAGVGNKFGSRAAIVYDPTNGKQVIFPLGRYGMGRRRQQSTWPNTKEYTGPAYYGSLWYSDANDVVTAANNTANWWRPLLYNLTITEGAVYWIDKYAHVNSDNYYDLKVSYNGKEYPFRLFESSFGWDINYSTLDFNQFSTACRADACMMKLIIKQTPEE